MSDDHAERKRIGDMRSMTKFVASMTQTVERHLKEIGDHHEVAPHDAEACAEKVLCNRRVSGHVSPPIKGKLTAS
jgi:hypothetical protein